LRKLTRFLVVLHRWIGVIACVYISIWFISGLVLMYVHFPAMSQEDKLRTLPPIEWSDVVIEPQKALEIANIARYPREFALEMSGGEPVYRILNWNGSDVAISARDGRKIQGVASDEALENVRQNLAAPTATLFKTNIHSDQWTVAGYWNSSRPFHVISLNDALDTHYYVSIETGEIVLDTVRSERFWNYLGAIPHWVYFEFIRIDTDRWFWVIMGMSTIGIFVAVSGLWLGISRLRKPYRHRSISPFRHWMKWHHIAGVFGGVFLLAWMITGLLSMYPGGFLEQRSITQSELEQYADNISPRFDSAGLRALAVQDVDARQASFVWLGGRPFILLQGNSQSNVSVIDGSGSEEQLPDTDIFAAAERLMPMATMVLRNRLLEGDEYWHTGFTTKSLPVLRVAFDDPSNTWFHIDPATGKIVGILDDTGRLDRWTNSGIHDVDLAFLHQHKPLWDIVVWLLSLAGLFISISGVVIGYKRLTATLRGHVHFDEVSQ